MSRTGKGCLTVALLLACLAASAPAHASFAKLGAISDQSAAGQQVAMDSDGRAVFVWERPDPNTNCGSGPCTVVEARVRGAGGTLGPVETISDPTRESFGPDVGVDEDGNAVFTWIGSDGGALFYVQARTRTEAGVLGPIENISLPGFAPLRPHVAVVENGDAVFLWEQFDLTGPCTVFGCVRVRARARSAAGVLAPQQDLSDPGKNALLPQLGVDEDGNAVFVWQFGDGTPSCTSCILVQARARSAAGILSPTQNLSDPGYASPGHVAVDEHGNAVFSWERFDGTTQCGGAACARVQTRARSAKGSLSKVQTLSDSGQDAVASQVGVDEKGNAVFVWTRGDGSNKCSGAACFRAQIRTRTASGTLSKIQNISEEGRHAFVPQVAVDERGNAVFVWERINEDFDCGLGTCSQVQARSRSSEGSLNKIETLSDLGPDATPVVAVDPDGSRDRKAATAAADWVGPATSIEAAVQQKGDS